MKSMPTRASSSRRTVLLRSALILTTLLVASCGTVAGRTKPPKYNPCAGWHVIVLDHRDVMTSTDKSQVLSHNCYGASIGCWAMPPDPTVCTK